MPPNSTPDVRVRLSAEGVQDVVNAFKKVSSQAKSTGAESAAGFAAFSTILNVIKAQLMTLIPAIALVSIVRGASETARWADELVRMSSIMGLSINDLRAFDVIATKTDVSVTQMRRGIVQFAKAQVAASAGNGNAIASFKALGLSLDQIKGKGTAEVLEALGKSMLKLKDSTTKTAAVAAIFGSRGTVLLPMLQEIGERGLPAVRKEAEKLGIVFDDKLTRAAAAVWDEFEVLGVQIKSLTQRFVGGLAPEVLKTVRAMEAGLGDSASGWEKAGEKMGKVINTLSQWFVVLAGSFNIWIALGRKFLAVNELIYESVAHLFDPGARKAAFEVFKKQMRDIDQDFAVAVSNDKERLKELKGAAKQNAPATGQTEAELEDEFRARLEITRANVDKEVQIAKAALRVRESQERASYDAGLQDVKDYYAKRIAAIKDTTEQEIAALQKRRAIEAQDLDEKAKAQNLSRTDTEIAQARLTAEQEIATTTSEQAKEIQRLTQERLRLDQKVFELRGNKMRADLIAMDEEIAKTGVLLSQLGDQIALEGESAEAAKKRRLEELRTLLGAQIQFNAVSQDAGLTMQNLQRDRQAIEAKVSAGLLSQAEGERQVLEVEKARVDELKLIAAEFVAAANATGDQQKIAQALDFQQSVNELQDSILTSESVMSKFRSTGINATQSALADLFDKGASDAKSWGAAIVSTVGTVVQALRRLLAEYLALKVAQALSLAIPGVSGGRGGSAGFPGEQAQVFVGATGGYVSGPGTGTSDSIPGRLSDGEFVVRAAVVQQAGVRDMLERLNRQVGYAEGGIVGAAAPVSGSIDATVGAEDGMVIRALETSAGDRWLVRALAKNRRVVRRLFG